MGKHYLARSGLGRSAVVEDRKSLQVQVQMIFEGQRGPAIEAHKYRPIRPLRSVVKESAKSGMRWVSTMDLARGSANAVPVNEASKTFGNALP